MVTQFMGAQQLFSIIFGDTYYVVQICIFYALYNASSVDYNLHTGNTYHSIGACQRVRVHSVSRESRGAHVTRKIVLLVLGSYIGILGIGGVYNKRSPCDTPHFQLSGKRSVKKL